MPLTATISPFKIAGWAFKRAFQQADPQILSQCIGLEVLCPEDVTGSVIQRPANTPCGNGRNGYRGHFTKVIAKVPLAKCMITAAPALLYHGRAKFRMSFSDYESVPYEVQRKLAEDYSKTEKKNLVA